MFRWMCALKWRVSAAWRRGVFVAVMLAAAGGPAIAKQGALVLGVFPRHNYTETQEMFRPLAKYLSEALGREVRLETARDYETFWTGVAGRRYDIVHLSQSQYVVAQRSHGYRVILKNEEFGESTLASVIVVRADSGITRLDQLKGKTVMFGGARSATMSYLVPREMLRAANAPPDSYKTEFALNPPNALMAVYLRRADACGVGEAVVRQQQTTPDVNMAEMRIIGRSASLPQLPWAVRGDMSAELRLRIQRALTDLPRSAAGQHALSRARLTRLVSATDADYEPFRQMSYSAGERLNHR